MAPSDVVETVKLIQHDRRSRDPSWTGLCAPEGAGDPLTPSGPWRRWSEAAATAVIGAEACQVLAWRVIATQIAPRENAARADHRRLMTRLPGRRWPAQSGSNRQATALHTVVCAPPNTRTTRIHSKAAAPGSARRS
jgi:hypothetical protein